MARGSDNSNVIPDAVTRQLEILLRMYLLACTTAASHVQLSTSAGHDHSVVVAALPALSIRLDLDGVDVLVAVGLLPQLLDDLVDV